MAATPEGVSGRVRKWGRGGAQAGLRRGAGARLRGGWGAGRRWSPRGSPRPPRGRWRRKKVTGPGVRRAYGRQRSPKRPGDPAAGGAAVRRRRGAGPRRGGGRRAETWRGWSGRPEVVPARVGERSGAEVGNRVAGENAVGGVAEGRAGSCWWRAERGRTRVEKMSVRVLSVSFGSESRVAECPSG